MLFRSVVRTPAKAPEKLGRDDEVCATEAELLESTPDVRLRLSPGIRLCGVNHVDSILESNLDDFLSDMTVSEAGLRYARGYLTLTGSPFTEPPSVSPVQGQTRLSHTKYAFSTHKHPGRAAAHGDHSSPACGKACPWCRTPSSLP